MSGASVSGAARAAILLALLGAVGCAENAILELTLTLPDEDATVGGTPVASVLTRFDSDTRAFDDTDWSGQPEHVALVGPSPENVTISVIALGEQIEQELAVRVAFCADREGCAGEDPLSELHFVFERAFYLGEYTRYAIDVSSPPESTGAFTEVPRCEVAGCRDGDALLWCDREGGVHVCEQ